MFLHRLALHLGMTISQLEKSLSLKEVRDWWMFDAQWGLPDVVQDIQNAMLCSIAVNIMRSSSDQPTTVEDFRVLREKGPEQQDFTLSEAQKFKRVLGGE